MTIRSTRSTVTFYNPFTLSGYPDGLPAGDYEVLVEEELLPVVQREAYRRRATYLIVHHPGRANLSEMLTINEHELVEALRRDTATRETNIHDNATTRPQEDSK